MEVGRDSDGGGMRGTRAGLGWRMADTLVGEISDRVRDRGDANSSMLQDMSERRFVLAGIVQRCV